jgi:hypothetical protein
MDRVVNVQIKAIYIKMNKIKLSSLPVYQSFISTKTIKRRPSVILHAHLNVKKEYSEVFTCLYSNTLHTEENSSNYLNSYRMRTPMYYIICILKMTYGLI